MKKPEDCGEGKNGNENKILRELIKNKFDQIFSDANTESMIELLSRISQGDMIFDEEIVMLSKQLLNEMNETGVI